MHEGGVVRLQVRQDDRAGLVLGPGGDEFSPHVFLEDVYDGEEVDGKLVNGFGVLTDGEYGHDVEFEEHAIIKGNLFISGVFCFPFDAILVKAERVLLNYLHLNWKCSFGIGM